MVCSLSIQDDSLDGCHAETSPKLFKHEQTDDAVRPQPEEAHGEPFVERHRPWKEKNNRTRQFSARELLACETEKDSIEPSSLRMSAAHCSAFEYRPVLSDMIRTWCLEKRVSTRVNRTQMSL